MVFRFFLSAVACVCAVSALAKPPQMVAVLDQGDACEPLPTQGEGGFDTVDGELVLRAAPPDYTQDTTIVPAQIGITFGTVLAIAVPPENGVYMSSVTHPPMGNQGRTRQTWPFRQGAGTNILGYTLEDDFELVTGDWIFRLSDGQNILFEQKFTLVPPPAGHPPACFGDVPTS
jgi:hypothetical protein